MNLNSPATPRRAAPGASARRSLRCRPPPRRRRRSRPSSTRRPSRTQSSPSRVEHERGIHARLARHRPLARSIRTYVGRLVVEKKPSGSTPSAGAGDERRVGSAANSGVVKSGGEKVVTIAKVWHGVRERAHCRHAVERALRITPHFRAARTGSRSSVTRSPPPSTPGTARGSTGRPRQLAGVLRP